MENLTQQYLKSILNYNEETGQFTWIVDFCRKIRCGQIAGTINDRGYICIRIKHKIYKAHRLAFLYMKGAFPIDQVDHINNIKGDNIWENLRPCNSSENQINTKPMKNKSSRYKGVYRNKKDNIWSTQITVRNKPLHIGTFHCEHAAALAYNEKALYYFGEFAYLNTITEK